MGDIEAVNAYDLSTIRARLQFLVHGPRQQRLVDGKQSWGFSRGPADTRARTAFLERIQANLRAIGSDARLCQVFGLGVPGKLQVRCTAQTPTPRWRVHLAVLCPSTGEWLSNCDGEPLGSRRVKWSAGPGAPYIEEAPK